MQMSLCPGVYLNIAFLISVDTVSLSPFRTTSLTWTNPWQSEHATGGPLDLSCCSKQAAQYAWLQNDMVM
jgi:hypothetical protein